MVDTGLCTSNNITMPFFYLLLNTILNNYVLSFVELGTRIYFYGNNVQFIA